MDFGVSVITKAYVIHFVLCVCLFGSHFLLAENKQKIMELILMNLFSMPLSIAKNLFQKSNDFENIRFIWTLSHVFDVLMKHSMLTYIVHHYNDVVVHDD